MTLFAQKDPNTITLEYRVPKDYGESIGNGCITADHIIRSDKPASPYDHMTREDLIKMVESLEDQIGKAYIAGYKAGMK